MTASHADGQSLQLQSTAWYLLMGPIAQSQYNSEASHVSTVYVGSVRVRLGKEELLYDDCVAMG